MRGFSRTVIGFIIVLLIGISLIPTSRSLTTEVQDGNKINLPITLSLKLWGFENFTQVKDLLLESLPAYIVHESQFPGDAEPFLNLLYINELQASLWYQSKITYRIFEEDPLLMFTEVFANSIQKTGLHIGNESSLGQHNGSVDFRGNEIELQNMSDFLADYNYAATDINQTNEQYTIHLINGKSITDFTDPHWYSLGRTVTLSENETDMRSVGTAGGRGLFYDPTAVTPKFDYNSTFSENYTITADFLAPRIVTLLETAILGTPYTFDFWPSNFLNTHLHFAQFLIGSTDDDSFYKVINAELIGERGIEQYIRGLLSNPESIKVADALGKMFPYLKIDFSKASLPLNKQPIIEEILRDATVFENGTSYVDITSDVAEDLKRTLRNTRAIYEKFPQGFYYALIALAESSQRIYRFVSADGKFPYTNQVVGLALYNLEDWATLGDDMLLQPISQLQLQKFGQMLAMPDFDDNLTAQIESPMSTYGVSDKWNYEFTNLEIEAMARRYAAPFNISARAQIDLTRSDLNDAKYLFWINTTLLDEAETKLTEADLYYRLQNFELATELYLEGYEIAKTGIKEINQDIVSYYNAFNFVGGLIILAYIINILNSLAIPRKDYYEKLNPIKDSSDDNLSTDVSN
ncbi:MAG: hypothetical protein IH840_01460 [Candidatus Heimdallarchaeota archaeon]|nr:hypothetical protein [Candidatus Heimdallarchaeota archaeon]